MDALRREIQEETGFLIMDIEPIGYILEIRKGIQNNQDWDKVISYVFSASSEKEIGTNYTEDENADVFRPIWMTLNHFIIEKEKNKANSYSGCFSDKRDSKIAKYLKNSMWIKCASENIRIKSRHLKGGDGFLAAFIRSTYALCRNASFFLLFCSNIATQSPRRRPNSPEAPEGQ